MVIMPLRLSGLAHPDCASVTVFAARLVRPGEKAILA